MMGGGYRGWWWGGKEYYPAAGHGCGALSENKSRCAEIDGDDGDSDDDDDRVGGIDGVAVTGQMEWRG